MAVESNGGTKGREQIVETLEVEYDGQIRPEAHFERFAQALQKAIDKAADEWGDGQHTANIQFAVRFRKVNPGQVGEYRITLG